MKKYTKNTCKKLLTASLIFLSYCVIKAESHDIEPKRNLATVDAHIASLGTPSDVSGVYADFLALQASDAAMAAQLAVLQANDVAMAAQLGVLVANDVTIMTDLGTLIANDVAIMIDLNTLQANDVVMMADLSTLVANDVTIMADLSTLIANDVAIMIDLNTLQANDVVMMADLNTLQANDVVIMADLSAIATDIASLGTPSDVSGIYTLLALIVANLQLDPVTQVQIASNSPSLQTLLTSTDPNPVAIANLLTYNTVLSVALSSVITATTPATQNNANTQLAINAVNVAINNFNTLAIQWNADGAVPSSAYSVAAISADLGQLKNSLGYMQTQQPV